MFAGTCPVSIDLFIQRLIGRHRAGCSDFNSFELLNTVMARTIFIFVGNLDRVLGRALMVEQFIWFWNFGGKLVANIREIFTKLI